MPYVKLPDGTNIFVESNDPQEIAKKTSEAQRKKNKSRGSDSVV